MSRQETVISPLTLGAGRKFSYTWGGYGNTAPNNDPVMTNSTARPTATTDNFWTTTVTGAPPASRGIAATNGRIAARWTSNTGTGYELVPNDSTRLTMPFQTVKGTGTMFNVDDFYCWSVSAILAFNAIPAAITGDLGLVLSIGARSGAPTRGRIRSATFAGMMLGPSNTGVTSFIVRQADGGALTFNQQTPTQPDQTQFNRYEIRLVGPTPNAEAQVKVFINNVLQFALPYGAGTVLPDQNQGAGISMGFVPSLVNFAAAGASTVTMHVPPFGMVVCAAPNEVMLSVIGN